MTQQKRPKASRQKVQAHRKRLRAQGLRPIQIWVPDVRAPGFAEEAHRQSLAVAKSRPAALAWVTAFMEDAKASGVVRRALDAAGLRDEPVAPPEPRP